MEGDPARQTRRAAPEPPRCTPMNNSDERDYDEEAANRRHMADEVVPEMTAREAAIAALAALDGAVAAASAVDEELGATYGYAANLVRQAALTYLGEQL